jgi:hypothetical protein
LSDGTETLLLLLDKLKSEYSGDLYADLVDPLLVFLFACTGVEKERLKLFGIFLQELGLLLDKV